MNALKPPEVARGLNQPYKAATATKPSRHTAVGGGISIGYAVLSAKAVLRIWHSLKDANEPTFVEELLSEEHLETHSLTPPR